MELLGVGVDCVGQAVPEVLDDAGRWRGWCGTDQVGQFVRAGSELGDLAAQDLEPLAGGGVVHCAVLERCVVAADRVLLLLDLGEDGGVLGAPSGVPVTVPFLGSGDRVGDQAGGAGVEVAQRLEDCGVGFVGWEPGGVAAWRSM